MAGKEKEFEDICIQCGQCCGSLDVPCRNLVKVSNEKYVCKDYENRLGRQKTVSGFTFRCVLIREHIANNTLRPNCPYRAI